MLMPDVTEILYDPEVGGGVAFQVRRVANQRTRSGVEQSEEIIDVCGNIQPESKSVQTSTSEDVSNEGIVIRAAFEFKLGQNNGEPTFVSEDEILWDSKRWRVTSVENWSKWGFSIAHATRVMDLEEVSNGMA